MSEDALRERPAESGDETENAGAPGLAGGYCEPLSIGRPELLIDGSDARFRELIYALFVTGSRLSDVREAFGREIGVTGPQYFILIGTAHFQGETGVSIGRLADYLHVAPSHVTTEVRKLVGKGLLDKRPNPVDGRGVLVSLTKAGEGALDKLAPYRRRINDILFDGFSTEEFEVLGRLVDRFVDTTERALAEIDRHESRRALHTGTGEQKEADHAEDR